VSSASWVSSDELQSCINRKNNPIAKIDRAEHGG
jgi:hypothetical protein